MPSFGQSRVSEAIKFIETLKAESPKDHGKPIDEYLITDINKDGVYEVIERVNIFSRESPGFLNVEISPAFNYDRIYSFTDGSFQENYKSYYGYQMERLEFYNHWLKMIENPDYLTSDSKQVVNHNKETFVNELNSLISRTEKNMN